MYKGIKTDLDKLFSNYTHADDAGAGVTIILQLVKHKIACRRSFKVKQIKDFVHLYCTTLATQSLA